MCFSICISVTAEYIPVFVFSNTFLSLNVFLIHITMPYNKCISVSVFTDYVSLYLYFQILFRVILPNADWQLMYFKQQVHICNTISTKIQSPLFYPFFFWNEKAAIQTASVMESVHLGHNQSNKLWFLLTPLRSKMGKVPTLYSCYKCCTVKYNKMYIE